MRFIGREYELKELNEEYNKGNFALSVIYGRRRVGKTYLIKEFLKDKKGYYFVALESNALINLSLLSIAVYEACGNLKGLPDFLDFESAFRYLFEYTKENRIVFVIDEYPYLAQTAEYISSLLQKLIDEYRDNSKLFLILCGSSMSFMENQVLAYKSPLYGRRTSQLKINPFNYLDAAKFVESYSYKEKAIVYGLTGGIAEYLTFFNDNVELKTNIINNFLKTSGRLFEEPTNLLKQELRQPKTYNDILFAIAGGSSKLNEIATKLNMQTGGLTYYINSLVELGIVEKKTPVLDRKTKRPVYVIKDTMFRFWYYFVQKGMNLINMELGEIVYDKQVEARLNDYMGSVFEKITIEYFEQRLRKGKLNFIPADYGNWWGNDKIRKQESEIDLLAYDESNNNCLFAEVKWRNQKTDETVLKDLIEKSMNFGCLDRYYWLISLSGFEKFTKLENVELIDINDVYEV
ncbi:MAG: ATP-binding protein [Catonella sp.]|uniref:ATP-binding protein n=1 Tax=Catonella sp. TaxID=2382125 RepID=UPI003FA154C6